jgi:hypothetical protein
LLKKGNNIMYSENEKNKSRNEIRIAREQDWLRERESFWMSPESTPEIDEWQSEMYELTGIYYSKTEIREMLDRFTATLATVFLNLNGLAPNDLSDAEYIFDQILDGPVACPFCEEAIEMANAKICIASGGKVGCVAERILNILGSVYVFDKKPEKRVTQAIQNAIRAYALGQDAACILFCRIVVELALKEKIPYEMLVRHLGPRKTKYDISDRLAVAAKEGFLTNPVRKLADNVRERANKICHEDTALTQKVYRVFDETCRVVCTLYTGRDPIWSFVSEAKLKT